MANPSPEKSEHRTIYRIIAVGLFVSKDGKFLLGKKDPKGGGVYPDCWHIPGGGVDEEKNETLLEALEREMREEVGIEVANGAVKLLDDSGTGGSEKTLDSGEVVWCEMKFNVFEIELDEYADEITVNPGDDIVETLWAEKDKLKDLQLTPPSIELFNKLGYLD